MGRVSGKVAIVTGAASGIGRGCAELLAAEGAKVIIADLDESGGSETLERIQQQGNDAEFYKLDVSREEEWTGLIRHMRSAYGALHILVNNAAICVSVPLLEMSVETWHRQIATNLDSVFFWYQGGDPVNCRQRRRFNHKFVVDGRISGNSRAHWLLRDQGCCAAVLKSCGAGMCAAKEQYPRKLCASGGR